MYVMSLGFKNQINLARVVLFVGQELAQQQPFVDPARVLITMGQCRCPKHWQKGVQRSEEDTYRLATNLSMEVVNQCVGIIRQVTLDYKYQLFPLEYGMNGVNYHLIVKLLWFLFVEDFAWMILVSSLRNHLLILI